MFTGIIEELGTIAHMDRRPDSIRLTIQAHKVLEGTQLGDSIAVNGVCLTVTDMTDSTFSADVMHETMRRSSFSTIKSGSQVNLERAMQVGGRLGGHIVSGHIDGTGSIRSLEKEGNALLLKVAVEPATLRGIIEKSSVALDDISLTVAAVTESDFTVSLIPHTREVTNLREKKAGSILNIETDVIGKYVEKMMQGACKEPGGRAEPAKKALTRAFLLENGF